MLEGQTRNDKKDIGRPYAVENPLNVSEASAQGTVKYGENRPLEWRIVLTLMVYRRKDLSAKVRGCFSLV